MQAIPADIVELYERKLAEASAPIPSRDFYKKWLRYFLDFCQQYGHDSADGRNITPSIEKLRSKKQPPAYRQQARHAVILYHEGPGTIASTLPEYPEATGALPVETPPDKVADKDKVRANGSRSEEGWNDGREEVFDSQDSYCAPPPTSAATPDLPLRESKAKASPAQPLLRLYDPRLTRGHFNDWRCLKESASPEWDAVIGKPAAEINTRHYSRKTLKAYADWGRDLQGYLNHKSPEELAQTDVRDNLHTWR
jgi:hypothetical protein